MKKIRLAMTLCSVFYLTGCVAPLAPLVVGGTAVTSATMMTDRRSTGAIVNDGVLEKRIAYEISKIVSQNDHHVTVTSYDGKVLLTGEVATQTMKDQVFAVARNSLDVLSVQDEVVVGELASITDRMSDSLLATKVRSALLATDGVSINQMKVTVDQRVVYLMGIVTEAEATLAGKVSSEVSGVVRVVKCFNVESEEMIQKRVRIEPTYSQEVR